MDKVKREVAFFLAVCMVMINVLTVFAEPVSDLAAAVAQENVSAEDKASASNAVYGEDTAEQEEASPADTGYAALTEPEDDPDALNPEEASPAKTKYDMDIFETVVDGVRITMIADKDVFPEGAELWAEKVEDSDIGEAIDKAIKEEKSEEEAEKNIASRLQFDIRMYFNGIEIQPDTSKGTVKISFAFEEELNNCLDVNVYHVTGEDDDLEAEALETEVATDEEVNEEEEIIIEDGADILPEKKTDGTIVSAGINGFSYYVVEFTYNELQYVLNGDESVKLSAILETLQLKGTVTAAEVSNEVLFTVTEDEDGKDWTVTALQGFISEEWMKVTLDGQVYKITVTDAQDPITYIDYEDGVKIERTVDDYIVMTENITEFEPGKFYVVTTNVSGHTRIKNNGTLASPSHLILTDGHRCDIFQGIENAVGNSLVIYGQTENSGSFNNGDGYKQCAGIGGGPNTEGGKLTINGGTVKVRGNVSAAGIGGGGFDIGGE